MKQRLLSNIRPIRFGRDVHGVLLLDKPKGESSNDVLQKVKRIYRANRAGHTGTLDPLATGMLPICFGEATKFSKYSLNSNKRYQVIAQLGKRTDTSDADGKVVQERPVLFEIKKLYKILESFRGKTLQIPSMYSSIKYQGKKLYEYVRNGIQVPRKPRSITIYELIFIRYEGLELELEIYCSKGTYIRTIIDDLGEKLGCGAHVTFLRRIAVSNYPVERMVTLEKLQKITRNLKGKVSLKFKILSSFLLPIDAPASDYPIMNLSTASSTFFKHGNPVYIEEQYSSLKGLIRVTEGEHKKFIGIGEINKIRQVIPRRIVINYKT